MLEQLRTELSGKLPDAGTAKADQLDKFLASDALDARLAKYVVLQEATPKVLAEFAQQGQEQAALVEQLLVDGGGNRWGKEFLDPMLSIYPGKPDAAADYVKMEAGNKVPFKITYLNKGGNGLGWTARLDIPGTLKTVVNHDGKFKYLVDEKGNFVPRDDVYYKGVGTREQRRHDFQRPDERRRSRQAPGIQGHDQIGGHPRV